MKKSVFTLLALLACAIYPVKAYEYFTIYFSDGTKSEAFYATDVDSICYSKISLDSIAYDEWQVQEIYTCDSVYRYPIAQIDSLSFKDVDINKVAKDIANVMVKVDSIINQEENLEVIKMQLPEIKKITDVDDAYITNQVLFIVIKDWGTISFYFPPDENINNESVLSIASSFAHRSQLNENQETSSDQLKACIVNQQYLDEKRAWFRDTVSVNMHDAFNEMGIACKNVNMPKPSFFNRDIFDYDLVFIKTHGYYDKKYGLHWLFTGEELLSHTGQISSIDSPWSRIVSILNNGIYSPLKMTFSRITEIRNGDSTHVYYTVISDEYIRASNHKFKDRKTAIVFNTACESMMGNDANYNNLAKAFVNRGAGSYFGYDDTNNIGAYGGCALFYCLLNGFTTTNAYNAMPQWCKTQDLYLHYGKNGKHLMDTEPKQGTKYVEEYHPYLLKYPDEDQCIAHPQTLDADQTEQGKLVKLSGRMKLLQMFNVYKKVSFSLKNLPLGFYIGDTPNMEQPIDSFEVMGNYDNSTLYMNWEKTLDENNLKPNTTYYYRAYMNDGYSNCYGEIKQFTTKDAEEDISDYEAYFVLTNDSTITFYYDNKGRERARQRYIVKENSTRLCYDNSIKTVVFDLSFANYKPQNTSFWFHRCYTLQNIVNLHNLNTSNVTDMRNMFSECLSLTSLDLSNFNTANVTNMEQMFAGCISLTSLDLSNFNTANVTNMEAMFFGCRSLTSLDLSNFNTANVTDMYCMFQHCYSLISLDLSNFNTANVTDMRSMFSECSSLTCLDLSSFNPANARIDDMFGGCESLKTIYANNWTDENNRKSVPFSNCINLVGGQGTKIGKNLYGYDEYGNPLYYYCGYDGNYAHIDGGKDNPGFFTAK